MKLILETQRLVLRSPKNKDYQDIVEGLNNKKVVQHLLHVPYPYTEEDAKKWIKKAKGFWRKKERKAYPFVIELKSKRKVIGCLHVMNIDSYSGTATTTSWVNEKYQRRGYMTESKIVVNDFLFKQLKLRKLCTQVYADNMASNRTQVKMGYVQEGILRKQGRAKSTGKLHDQYVYGLFKQDWIKISASLKKEIKRRIQQEENN